jgi:hypothetical protein
MAEFWHPKRNNLAAHFLASRVPGPLINTAEGSGAQAPQEIQDRRRSRLGPPLRSLHPRTFHQLPTRFSYGRACRILKPPESPQRWVARPWKARCARGVDMPPFVRGNPANEEAWQLLSARWAAGASGVVRVLVGPGGIRPDTVLTGIELPTAEENPLVTRIITIPVK